jgi:hypothetical protein
MQNRMINRAPFSTRTQPRNARLNITATIYPTILTEHGRTNTHTPTHTRIPKRLRSSLQQITMSFIHP